jgi:hypothetical protein
VHNPDYFRFDNTGVVYMGEWKVFIYLYLRIMRLMDLVIIIIQMKVIMKEHLCRACHMDMADLLMLMEIIIRDKLNMEEPMVLEYTKAKI